MAGPGRPVRVEFRRDRRLSDPGDVATPADVAYFRRLVACLEGGDDGGLWDLPCARLALAGLERRVAALQRER